MSTVITLDGNKVVANIVRQLVSGLIVIIHQDNDKGDPWAPADQVSGLTIAISLIISGDLRHVKVLREVYDDILNNDPCLDGDPDSYMQKFAEKAFQRSHFTIQIDY